jgi:hypothetical protein
MKKVEGKKKRKSPSREKYDNENPTVSARVTEGTRDRLRIVLAKLGMSLADALKVLAGDLEVKTRPIDEARQAGYEEAKNRYLVTYPCSICGNLIPIKSPKAKEAASRYMVEHGWGHAKCHERTRRP